MLRPHDPVCIATWMTDVSRLARYGLVTLAFVLFLVFCVWTLQEVTALRRQLGDSEKAVADLQEAKLQADSTVQQLREQLAALQAVSLYVCLCLFVVAVCVA